MTVLEVALSVGWAITLVWWGVDHLVNIIKVEKLKEVVLRLNKKLLKCQKKKE